MEIKRLPPHRERPARILTVTVHPEFFITGLRDTKAQKEHGLLEKA